MIYVGIKLTNSNFPHKKTFVKTNNDEHVSEYVILPNNHLYIFIGYNIISNKIFPLKQLLKAYPLTAASIARSLLFSRHRLSSLRLL